MQNTGIIRELTEVTHRWMGEEGPIVSLKEREMVVIEESGLVYAALLDNRRLLI